MKMENNYMIKKVVSAWYVHKSNIEELCDSLPVEESEYLLDKLDYYKKKVNKPFTIIKYDRKSKNVSLIYSPDWDTVNEPTVGTSYTIKPDNSIVTRKGGSQVYHNKWQFVGPNYSGFNIQQAKQRTKEWNSIPNINSLKKFIGNKKYWHDLLRQNDMEI